MEEKEEDMRGGRRRRVGFKGWQEGNRDKKLDFSFFFSAGNKLDLVGGWESRRIYVSRSTRQVPNKRRKSFMKQG